MAIQLYAEINLFAIIVLLIIALTAYTFAATKTMRSKLFVNSIWCAIFANFFDLIWNIANSPNVKVPPFIPRASMFLYFLMFGLTSYFWCLYASYALDNRFMANRRRITLCAIPLAVLVVLLICNIRTGFLFYIDARGHYHRGPYYALQQAITYSYIVYTSFKAIWAVFKKKILFYQNDLLSIAFFSVLPLLCGVVQTIYQELPILSVGIVISYLLVYINRLRSLVLQDPLTGINNRRQLFIHLNAAADSLKKGECLYFLFMDVDSFKYINDTYGHTEGDAVLCLIADALNGLSKKTDGFCARYAGDEFAFVQVLPENGDISSVKQQIMDAVLEKAAAKGIDYAIELSIGYAVHSGQEQDLQKLIFAADHNMYEEKLKRKQYAKS